MRDRRRAQLAGVLGFAVLAAAVLQAPAGAAGGGEGARSPVPSESALSAVGPALRLPVPSAALRAAGQLPAGTPLSVALALRPRDPAGLARYAAEVNEPGSPGFHHFLSPDQLARRFGPGTATVRAAEAALRAAGLEVGAVPSDHLLVPASGSASRVAAAFHVRLAAYRLPAGGLGWAASGTPLLSSSVAGFVAAVVGLDQLAHAQALGVAGDGLPAPLRGLAVRGGLAGAAVARRAGTGGEAAPYGSGASSVQAALDGAATSTTAGLPSPCSSALNAAEGSGGWTEDAIANAYGFAPLLVGGDLGQHETIAVYELEPFSRSDVAAFDRCYFGRSHTSQVKAVAVAGFDFRGAGVGESLLDVEELSALTPAARLLVYEAPNTTYGQIAEYNAIVSQDRANIVTTSWAECETQAELGAPGALQVENTIFEEAAAEGQTVLAAAGDTGSDSCASTQFGSTTPASPYLSVDDPASQPYVVGVGGVSLTSASPTAESAWNDGASSGGGGGGRSNTWPSPPWQAASGVPGIVPGRRQVPDVSASADEFRGVTVELAGTVQASGNLRGAAAPSGEGWTVLGGTSASTPQWAAALALAADSRACASLPRTAGGRDLGFVGPSLYAVASDPSGYAASFTDVVRGNNDVFHLGHGYSAGPGYNMVAGLGTPVLATASGAPALASNLCALATGGEPGGPSVPVVSGVSPASGPVSGGGTVTITGSGFGSTPGAVRVLFGSAAARVRSVAEGSIVVTAPLSPVRPHAPENAAAGDVDVTVTVGPAAAAGSSTGASSGAGGATPSAGSAALAGAVVSSTPSPRARYDYLAGVAPGPAVPSVTGLVPAAGPPSGGGAVAVFGSGFRDAGAVSSVTFGGVPAAFSVVSDGEIIATPPPLGPSTACSSGPGFQPAVDCQVQLRVGDANGSSSILRIEPGLSGDVNYDSAGIVIGARGREIAESPTEYDYAPPPVITSITPNPVPAMSSAPVVVHGRHFSLLTLDWVDFGPPSSTASEQVRIAQVTPTSITVFTPVAPSPPAGSTEPLVGGVTVQSATGASNTVPFSYSAG